MKIAFDHQIFSLQKYGGISRYFHELIQGLGKMEGVETSLSLRYSNNQYLMSANSGAHRYFFNQRQFPGKKELLYLLNIPGSISGLRRKDLDIFHPTYYGTYFLPHLKKKPFVLTVHDMIHELFHEQYANRTDIPARKKVLIENAARIIVVSEHTKKDILKFHGVDESKIHVIHHGDSFSGSAARPMLHADLPDKYILFVGLRGGYKNFAFFVESIAELFSHGKDLNLVCIGGGAFTPAESALFGRLGISKRVRQHSASDEALAGYYRQAALFVFPSLYEGFGIPILEAFGTGCPMAVSRSSSLPEVAGDAVVYFDPRDSQSILSAVKALLHDQELRERMKRLGSERLKLFDWATAALKTREVYRGILETTR